MKYITKVAGVGGGFYHAHKVVTALFPGQQRYLFSNQNGNVRVMSDTEPLQECFDSEVEVRECKEAKFPKAGESVAFTMRFNPTRKVPDMRKPLDEKGRRPNKRLGIDDPEQAEAWLRRKLGEAGVTVASLALMPEGLESDSKPGGSTIYLMSFVAMGIVTVCDAETLQAAVVKGFGGGLSMGYGFLDMFR